MHTITILQQWKAYLCQGPLVCIKSSPIGILINTFLFTSKWMKVKIHTLPSNNLLFRGNDYQVITPVNQFLQKLGPIFISTLYISPLTFLNILFFEALSVMYFLTFINSFELCRDLHRPLIVIIVK